MLLDLIQDQARHRPDAIAIAGADVSISYSALPLQVARAAASIAAADPGDRPVGIRLPNGPDWVIADLALLQLRRPAIPLPSFFLPEQAEAALADAGATSIIEPGGLRLLDHRKARLPQDTAKVSYTSGSTGSPKGIPLTEMQLLATAQAVVARLGAARAVRHLPLLPLGVLLENVAGLYATLIAGGSYLAEDSDALGLSNPFAPDFSTLAAQIETLGATSLILVPELLRGLAAALAASGRRLPNLKLVAVGGSRVSDALIEDAWAVGLPVIQGYGLTEAGSVVTIEDPSEAGSGTAGRPLGHVRIGFAGDGEIIIHPNDPLGIQDHGPIHTGDIGTMDAAGRLIINGRKSNLLITAFGRNVSPEWVESELLGQPEIVQAVVHGDGEASLRALIVPRSAQTDPSGAVERANVRLPPYARIASWELSPPFLPADGTLTTNGRPRREAIMRRRAAMPFFNRLVMQTSAARLRLQSVPQLRAGLQGAINLDTYVAYLTQAYHHVRHTVPLMEAARARLGHRPELVAALDDYIAEETGHEHWILDDIAACGIDPGKAVADGPSAATAAMVDHAYRTIRKGNPVAFFGMVFVLEGTSIALAQQGADAVRQSLGLPREAFRYLTSHGALDQDHMRFFETLVNGLDDESDRQAIIEMAEAIFDRFAAIFATIEMEDKHALA
ncbi:AMP-binding protein [Sphingomonas oryzagri]